MKLKKLTAASLLTAVGVVSSHIIYVPIAMAKAFPIQHGINLLGTGSLLALPGSMIGAFLVGLLFKIGTKYNVAILCKGGHSINDANDVLYSDGKFKWFIGERINNKNTHGTGCTLSSAIASYLALGNNL